MNVFAQTNIAVIKKAIIDKGAAWEAKENNISLLSPELRKRLLGAIKPRPAMAKARFIELPTVGELPDSLDWRTNNGNWLTPVRNQGQCGSCWAFSACAQVESWWLIHHDRQDTLPDVSEQQILISSNAGSCEGGSTEGALSWIQEEGVAPEAFFPYQAADSIDAPTNLAEFAHEIITFPDWGYITLAEINVDLIKQALMIHPVSASYTVYADFYSYNSGVYEHVSGEEEGGHAILIVGWNDADECWICKNSWGPGWGDDGYFRIRWNDCGMGDYIPFIYDTHTAAADIAVSQTQIDISITSGQQYQEDLIIENHSQESISFSAIDDQLPRIFHSSEFNAYNGLSIWCGDADLGGYDDYWLQYLDLPAISLSGASDPVLTLMANWSIESLGSHLGYDGWDGWNVWISVDGGQNYTVLPSPSIPYNSNNLWSFGDTDQGWGMGYGIAGWGGSSGGWKEISYNLSAYKQSDVIIRFAFASDRATCSRDDANLFGLILDDILISNGNQNMFYHDGSTMDGLTLSGGGSKAAEWLDVDNAVGQIAGGESRTIIINVDAAGLDAKAYTGRVRLQFSDTATPEIMISVNLNVQTDVKDIPASPTSFELLPNFPNPFNQGTMLMAIIPIAIDDASIDVYNSLGQHVRSIHSGMMNAGRHRLYWDGRDSNMQPLSSGIYLIVMKIGKHKYTRKVCQIK